jgi:hypothetical protein
MRRFLLSAALIVGLMPAGAFGSDQETAQQIAEALRGSGRLQDYSIGVTFENGRAKLLGRVASEEQAQTAVEMAQQLPYVSEVENRLEIKASPKRDFAVQPTAAQEANQTLNRDEALFGSSQPKVPSAATLPVAEEASPLPAAPVRQLGGQQALKNNQGAVRQTNGIGHHHGRGAVNGGAMNGGVVNAGGAAMAGAARTGTPIPTGIPASSQPQRVAYDQPNMPCYSWPSYASHPNYAGVTYPNQYSASAWPYIGPFYPYPQVPLGWRKVTMEWKDGWWWLDFNDHARTFRR